MEERETKKRDGEEEGYGEPPPHPLSFTIPLLFRRPTFDYPYQPPKTPPPHPYGSLSLDGPFSDDLSACNHFSLYPLFRFSFSSVSFKDFRGLRVAGSVFGSFSDELSACNHFFFASFRVAAMVVCWFIGDGLMKWWLGEVAKEQDVDGEGEGEGKGESEAEVFPNVGEEEGKGVVAGGSGPNGV